MSAPPRQIKDPFADLQLKKQSSASGTKPVNPFASGGPVNPFAKVIIYCFDTLIFQDTFNA